MAKTNKTTKYIFVTGGVISGVGKGITAASVGAILKGKGFKVSIQKFDPYLNVDAGLLNPAEHGECFVTHDGAETDLDLGHYERFLDEETNRDSIYPSGKLFQLLIEKERAGGFHGQTVQLIPHLTGAIHEAIERAGRPSDIHIVEIGGTVGDYEALSYVEAIRTFANIVGRENCLYIHVVYAMWLSTSKEFKTKPAQNAIKDLGGFGIVPDIVAVRGEKNMPRNIGEKIAKFASIGSDAVILLPDSDSVYDVPLTVLESGVLNVLNRFVGNAKVPAMKQWRELSANVHRQNAQTVTVGLIAKYTANDDTYLSVTEALKSAAFASGVDLKIKWVNAEKLKMGRAGLGPDSAKMLSRLDGLVVPGGFGSRGIDGKIAAATYALEHDKPYLGLCLGLQMAAVAAARLGGLKKAASEEILKTVENVIYIMPDQKGKESTGGTMRLGDYPARLVAGSKVAQIYGADKVVERHRHRYEVNKKFLPAIKKGGLVVSGTSPDGKLVEFVEAPDKKFFVATQAHPEFKSRPTRPHPMFLEFIAALKED
ncbi:MAG: CTP synthase [Candidatus Nomurabacteria bacterium]|jgi:CTP synthase|nr:CTP synthase [Candidatus Nomurabacteria bacterium]